VNATKLKTAVMHLPCFEFLKLKTSPQFQLYRFAAVVCLVTAGHHPNLSPENGAIYSYCLSCELADAPTTLV